MIVFFSEATSAIKCVFDHSFAFQGPETSQTNVKWSRPAPPELKPAQDTLEFQQIDIDHYTGELPAVPIDPVAGSRVLRSGHLALFVTGRPLPGMPGSQIAPVPIMRIYGITAKGNSVCCHVHGFSPYFFVSAPEGFSDKHCLSFKVTFEEERFPMASTF